MVRSKRKISTDDEDSAGRAEPTAKYSHFCSKDGLYYKSYELMVQANKRANERKLQELGLQQAFQPRKNSTKKQKLSPRSLASSSAEPTRRSKRIRKEPVPEDGGLVLPDDDNNNIDWILSTPKKKYRPIRPVTPDGEPVTAAGRQKIGQKYHANQQQQDQDGTRNNNWLKDLQAYLIQQEQISSQNERSVMRQVEKLSTGVGVTYHRWGSDVYFCKGQKIDLTWDMEALYAQACDFENEHGRDLGNGWLMRHPIKKMNNFQRFLLEQMAK